MKFKITNLLKPISSGLVLLIVVALTQITNIHAQSSFTHDLLFLQVTYTGNDWDESRHESNLFHLNTTTGTISALNVTDRPISSNALSPDSQRLIVFRDNLLCVVNNEWRTVFCLPEDVISFDKWRPLGFHLMDSFKIYWESDSQSFWMAGKNTADTCPTLLQIGVDDGTILNTISLEAEICTNSNTNYCIAALSPDTNLALITPCDSINISVYNYETRELMSNPLGNRISLSPEGQRLAIAISPFQYHETVRIGYIFDLNNPGEFIRGYPTEAPWLVPIDPEPNWEDNPEFTWLDANSDNIGAHSFFWSNSGQALAFRREVRERDEFSQPYTATYVIELSDQIIHPLTRDSGSAGELFWAPDDTAIAQVLFMPGCCGTVPFTYSFSIVTMDSELHQVLQSGDENGYAEVRSVTWIPRGWLKLDEFQE
jgi:hypothetical protein